MYFTADWTSTNDGNSLLTLEMFCSTYTGFRFKDK